MEKNIEKIIDFEKRSWAIKKIAIEKWGETTPCPIRFSVNTYHSCDFKCPYCYIWADKGAAHIRSGFRKALLHDIKRAVEFGVKSCVVEISASTDPFQYIEEKEGESLFAIEELLNAGFRVLIVTKNPSMLLLPRYLNILKNDNVFVDVTITSLREGIDKNYFLTNNGPTAENKLEAIRKIIKLGKDLRVKIEPVVPSFRAINGQSSEDLRKLVEVLHQIGVKMVIAKTLRINSFMPNFVVSQLLDYYKENGELVGSNYILSAAIRKKLLQPIYDECNKLEMKFCPCYDFDVFVGDERVIFCDIPGETKDRIDKLYRKNARMAE